MLLTRTYKLQFQTMEELKSYKMKMSRAGTNCLFPSNLAFGKRCLENKLIAA